YDALFEAVCAWSDAYADRPQPTLTVRFAPGLAHVTDRRRRGHWQTHVLTGPAAMVLQRCFDEPRPARVVVEEVSHDPDAVGPEPVTPQSVAAALDDLVEKRLVLRDGGLV